MALQCKRSGKRGRRRSTTSSADQSKFAQLAQDFLQAKNAASGYSQQIRDNSAATKSFGESISEARGKLSGLFEVTGAAVAFEAISKLIGVVKEYGERALDIRNMADVLGVTTGQFQAMAAAADEAGISDSVLMRANERLKTTLDEARDGSPRSAIAKLHERGITNAQIASSTFALNDVLQVIHDR